MGHYCRICGRTRANEKFSGKGHKNHICKSCSGKSRKQGMENNSNENDLILETKILSKDERIQPEDIYFNNICFSESELEEQNTYVENDEEIPF